MFCEETIVCAYNGSREYDDIDGENAFFDCYHDLAYHVTEGNRIVLETEHYYISLDAHGVTLSEKNCSIKEFEQNGEWLEPFIHTDTSPAWIDYESTLFVGERLRSVEKSESIFLLQFDDFLLKIIPHELKELNFPTLQKAYHFSYNHVLGYESRLKRKCNCGGDGELLLDFVSDYVVRCCRCKKSTWAGMNAKDAISEWESGTLECDLSDITIE